MTIFDPDQRAGALQRAVMRDEADNIEKGLDDYSESQVRQAIVHTRQDMVLIASHLSSANRQLATMRRLLWVIVVIVCWSVLK
jgi:hypothetical protein